MPYSRMRIVFPDARLALVRTDQAAKTKLPFPVIKSLREKLIVIEAAPDERGPKELEEPSLRET